MAGVGQKASGVGQHAGKGAEHPKVRKACHLLNHARFGVVEPPSGALLQLALGFGSLKAPDQGADHRIVCGVQGVDDGFGQFAGVVQLVQEFRRAVRAAVGGDAVKAAVGANALKHAVVHAAQRTVVQLHHPAELCVFAADEQKNGIFVFFDLVLRQSLTVQALFQDGVELLLRSGVVH